MTGRELPSGKSVASAVFWNGLLAGVACGVLVVLFLVPVIRFSRAHLYIGIPPAAASSLLFTLVASALQKRRVGKIVRYLDARRSGQVSQQERHQAFEQVMNLPGRYLGGELTRFADLPAGIDRYCVIGR